MRHTFCVLPSYPHFAEERSPFFLPSPRKSQDLKSAELGSSFTLQFARCMTLGKSYNFSGTHGLIYKTEMTITLSLLG